MLKITTFFADFLLRRGYEFKGESMKKTIFVLLLVGSFPTMGFSQVDTIIPFPPSGQKYRLKNETSTPQAYKPTLEDCAVLMV